MSRLLARYEPSRQYLISGLLALAGAAFSIWWGFRWAPAFLPGGIFAMFAVGLLALRFGPSAKVYDTHLKFGRHEIPWSDIRRVDRTGWISPLVVYLTLANDRRVLILYPGDLASSTGLLRQIRKLSRQALIDGIPHRQFWGEALPPAPVRKELPSPKYRLMTPEDEAEVERLFQRLKSVGHLDAKSSTDEK